MRPTRLAVGDVFVGRIERSGSARCDPLAIRHRARLYTRRMGETNDSTTVLDRVRELVSAEGDILVAIVFGSMATGRCGPESDLDIAALGKSPFTTEQRTRLIRQLAAETGRPVDLVDLRTAGLPVLRSALAGGKRIVCKDQAAYAALVSKMLLDNADFEPYRKRMLRERRDAWIH